MVQGPLRGADAMGRAGNVVPCYESWVTTGAIVSNAPIRFGIPGCIRRWGAGFQLAEKSDDNVAAVIHVQGVVQGVGYRYFVQAESHRLGLSGYCRNLPDGCVLVEAEGARGVIEALVQRLREGPRGARVKEVDVRWGPFRGNFSDFSIRY